MSANPAGLPPRFLRTPEAARFLGLSGRTLEKHRTYGTGPAYRKLGGRVVYSIDDLQAWIARAATIGYRPVWSGSYPASPAAPPLSWCYLERDGDPLMIEFVQFG